MHTHPSTYLCGLLWRPAAWSWGSHPRPVHPGLCTGGGRGWALPGRLCGTVRNVCTPPSPTAPPRHQMPRFPSLKPWKVVKPTGAIGCAICLHHHTWIKEILTPDENYDECACLCMTMAMPLSQNSKQGCITLKYITVHCRWRNWHLWLFFW